MSKSPHIPDAWDDSWESQVDHSKPTEQPAPAPEKKISSRAAKAQKRAQHAEFNRQLWAEAESPQAFHFLESRAASVPLKSDFKPPVTLLSRKPPSASRRQQSQSPASHSPSASPATLDSATAGIQRLAISSRTGSPAGMTATIAASPDLAGDATYADGDSDDEEEPPRLTAEERQAKAQRDREEKQRKYEEVRERLFGSSSSNTNAAKTSTGSGASSPGGSATPPSHHHHHHSSRNSHNRDGNGGGRGRGKNRSNTGSRESRERKEFSAGGAAAGKGGRQLYDPGYTQKPGSNSAQRGGRRQEPNCQTNTNNNNNGFQTEQQAQETQQTPLRAPRGPDGSGRGGFGFSPRGGRLS
ncbi:hypothetical protein FQN53_000134 [Emmonsiellopsis sp. PD_33]|nr:hypothetical protein FQN53_000134 [Emmonsiellopsis sp. PD_33]